MKFLFVSPYISSMFLSLFLSLFLLMFSSTSLASSLSGAVSEKVLGEKVLLCHVANAGFLIKGKSAKVILDGMTQRDDYNGSFFMPSDETRSSLLNDPTINVSLVTHSHGDHFDAAITLQHLRANPKVKYVMPPEAFELLQAEGLTELEGNRVHAVYPALSGEPKTLVFEGVSVDVYQIDHGNGQPQNIGYGVTVDGFSLFHPGDISATREQLKAAGLNQKPTDVLLLPFWYGLGDEVQFKAVAESWQAETIVPMHFGAGEPEWMKRFGGKEAVREMTHEQWPNSIRLDTEMACMSF